MSQKCHTTKNAVNTRLHDVFAVNMNGTVTRVKSSKDIQPGCEIVVPVKKKNHSVSLAEIISLGVMTSTMLTAIVTLIRK